jgi:hypothetical protein
MRKPLRKTARASRVMITDKLPYYGGPQGHGLEGRASPTQRPEQPSGKFASTDAATREDHQAVQIGATSAALLVHSRSVRQSLPSSPPRTSYGKRPPRSSREGDIRMARDHGSSQGCMIPETRLAVSVRPSAVKLTSPR